MSHDYRRIWRDGLWDNNVVFAQLLALCPLLAVTGTAINGLGLGIATTLVLIASNLTVSAIRNVVRPEIRIPVFVLVIALFRGLITPEVRIPVFILLIAAIVTLTDMVLNAWMHEMHKVLGLFIPLIVTNCAILGRAESFASRQPVLPALTDALSMGLGFTWVLVALGATREILGAGTLFANAALLLGDGFSFMEFQLIDDYRGFLLMALPPGGFLMLGFIMAGKRVLDARAKTIKERATVCE